MLITIFVDITGTIMPFPSLYINKIIMYTNNMTLYRLAKCAFGIWCILYSVMRLINYTNVYVQMLLLFTYSSRP